MKPLVVHVAQVEITEASGMGRVAWHWRREFERRGYEFIHIGTQEVGPLQHASLFPYAAYREYTKLKRPASLFLIHEPASGTFARRVQPTIVVSHGIERRRWQLALEGRNGSTARVKLRSRLLHPLWRLRQCDSGLRSAARLLLVNQDDANFVQHRYRRSPDEIFVYKNGVYPSQLNEDNQPTGQLRVLFLGAWLEGKGYRTMIEAARILDEKGMRIDWLLAGTRADAKTVLGSWPSSLHHLVENVSDFGQESEENLFARSNIFVLPSFCEGQPLSLLQAMESGRCCITTDSCGQRELIRHNDNGLLHQPGDAIELASLIELCAANRKLRSSLGRNAKRSTHGRTWETVASEVVDFLETRV